MKKLLLNDIENGFSLLGLSSEDERKRLQHLTQLHAFVTGLTQRKFTSTETDNTTKIKKDKHAELEPNS